MRALGLLVLLGACGGDGEEAQVDDWPATCDSRDSSVAAEVGLCRTWYGEETADVSEFRDYCEEQVDGVFGSEADKPCPGASEQAIGRCVTDQGFGLALDYLYYAPAFALTTARDHCESLSSCTFACTFEAL